MGELPRVRSLRRELGLTLAGLGQSPAAAHVGAQLIAKTVRCKSLGIPATIIRIYVPTLTLEALDCIHQ